jgi:hypothetical protein
MAIKITGRTRFGPIPSGTTTTTSTTTTTTTAGTYRISVYGANQYTPSGDNRFNIQYSTDFGSTWYNIYTDITTTSCTSFGYYDAAPGSNFRFRIVKSGTVSPIKFNYGGFNSSTCPADTSYTVCALEIPGVSSTYALAVLVQVDAGTGNYTFC